MRHHLLVLVLAFAATACADPLVDPTGNWDATYTWTSGTCQLTGASAVSTTVTRARDGYVISESGRSLTGTVRCSSVACQISWSETGPGDPGSGVESLALQVNLSVDTDDAITGSGSAAVRFSDGRTCFQAFTVAGRLR
jgi:hypothetical protein